MRLFNFLFPAPKASTPCVACAFNHRTIATPHPLGKWLQLLKEISPNVRRVGVKSGTSVLGSRQAKPIFPGLNLQVPLGCEQTQHILHGWLP
jgi:hypothetical protein